MKILIVDDEPEIAELIKPILELKGYTVVSVQTGQDALDIYPKENPDVILLDLGLPDIDGREVLKNIKLKSPQAKIIIVSGYSDTKTQQELISQGADYFLSKPVIPSKLVGALSDIFKSSP
jgi:two-component system KDP operon response regulator KdpE